MVASPAVIASVTEALDLAREVLADTAQVSGKGNPQMVRKLAEAVVKLGESMLKP